MAPQGQALQAPPKTGFFMAIPVSCAASESPTVGMDSGKSGAKTLANVALMRGAATNASTAADNFESLTASPPRAPQR